MEGNEIDTTNLSDNQNGNKVDKRKLMPHLWKKGQSGNIMGRPKGKTMKEYAREYLERMTNEERDEWLEGIEKHKIWEMAEGKAKQDVDANVNATINVIIPPQMAEAFNINANTDTETIGGNTQQEPI